jgi:hypothetical protein
MTHWAEVRRVGFGPHRCAAHPVAVGPAPRVGPGSTFLTRPAMTAIDTAVRKEL